MRKRNSYPYILCITNIHIIPNFTIQKDWVLETVFSI